MPYNEILANRTREVLSNRFDVEEKRMMGGLVFMVDGKMCVGITNDALMCRIDPAQYEEALEKDGCRQMDFTGRPMKGFVFVDEEALKTKTQLMYRVGLCLEFNKKAKASQKKK
ncbi:MAG TPA: TfoX/Sxy family protein [Bacteroidia bacterium]|nr:TfoX/Sxy family protein [Bacteroidia bacterium]